MDDTQLREEETADLKQRREAELKRDRYRHITTRILIYYFGFIVFYLLVQMIISQRSSWYIFLYVVLPAIAFVIIILVARRRGLIGGIISIAIGVACLYIVFNLYVADPSGLGGFFAVFLFFFGVIPPITVGILFILSWRIDEKLNEPQNQPPQY